MDYSKRNIVKEFDEKVVSLDRISRTVKGGRRIRFRALVVVGDKKGRVGFAVAKSTEVASAIAKATEKAKRKMVKIDIVKDSISHKVEYKLGAGHVILMPAREGTSVIAGGPVRSVIEAVGIKNILTKNIGSRNKVTVVKTTIEALKATNKK